MADHHPHRPRRSTRNVKVPPTAPSRPVEPSSSPLRAGKQQRRTATAAAAATAPDPEQWLKFLLQNPKSILTTIDISPIKKITPSLLPPQEVLNAGAWDMLPEKSRGQLKKLLPPTAFVDFQPSLGQDHPAAQERMNVDNKTNPDASPVDSVSMFTDPHFLAAARTFQDHIYSNWLSASHQDKVAKFETALRDGTLAVPWKDEQWLETNPGGAPLLAVEESTTTTPCTTGEALGRTASWKSRTLAGGATQVKLTTLVEKGIIRIGDVLAYRRTFSNLNLTIEKDAIIDSIDPATHTVTVLSVIGTSKTLPENLLGPLASDSDATTTTATTPIHSIHVTSPAMFESGLLDIDGRVDKSQRPNGNAWKSVTVWRLPQGASRTPSGNGRGGRDNYGTLFYLRGNYYHEEF